MFQKIWKVAYQCFSTELERPITVRTGVTENTWRDTLMVIVFEIKGAARFPGIPGEHSKCQDNSWTPQNFSGAPGNPMQVRIPF